MPATGPNYVGFAKPDRADGESVAGLLRAHGAQMVFHSAPGAWDKCLELLTPGSVLFVDSLASLGSSLPRVFEAVLQIDSLGVRLVSVEDDVDTFGPAGLTFLAHVRLFGSTASRISSEATTRAQKKALAEGRTIGRPSKLAQEAKDHARRLLASGASYSSVSAKTGLSRSSVARLAKNMPKNVDTSGF